MIKFRQHIPGFVSGVDPAVIDAPDMQTLLAHEHFDFYRELVTFQRSGAHLMAVSPDGGWWAVLGTVTHTGGLDTLPEWEAGKARFNRESEPKWRRG